MIRKMFMGMDHVGVAVKNLDEAINAVSYTHLTLPTNFLSARCKTAPYIEPIFFVGQGFIPCRQIFCRRGVKPHHTC